MASGMSAAMLAELQGYGRVFVTLDLTLGGESFKFAQESVASASAGMYLPYITEGGWGGDLARSISGRSIALQTPQLQVSVFDEKRAIQAALGGPSAGEVYGSTAEVYLRSKYVDAGDHYKLINGILTNYEGEDRVWTFTLEPDLQTMRGENRLPRITEIDFPNAPAANYGEETWCVYGSHISQGFSGVTGMIEAPLCVDETNYWWLASVGNVSSVPKVWKDGVDDTSNWTLERKLINGQWFSIIRDTSSTAVDGDSITFDCYGMEDDGDGTGGEVIEKPMEVLENIIANWGYNQYPDDSADGVTWIARTSAPINTTHFDETTQFLEWRNHPASLVLYKSDTVLEILEKVCGDFDVFVFWAWDWTIGVRPKDPSIAAIYDGTLIAQRNGDFLDTCVKLPANPDQQVSEYEVAYHWQAAEGNGLSRNLVKDTSITRIRSEAWDFETGAAAL